MPALLIYLVKVNVALLAFCLGYYAVLRHLTFYTLNRVYLITAILFSTLYPFINVTAFVNRHQEIARPIQVVIVNWQAPANALVQSVSHHDKWYWLQTAFWLGVIVLAIRLAMQLLSLYRLHRESEPVQLRHYSIRAIKGNINPFSFWRSIYINPDNHPPQELNAILEHEQIHVNEWHTLDILLGEVSTVFYWFNPGVWLMKRAIRENIEFITDRRILQQGMDCKTYQYSLVNVSFETRHNAIVNHFNISTIKKRIMMMNAKRSSNANLSRYVFLIPIVVALLLVFSVSKAELHKAATSSKHLLTNIKTAVAKIDLPFKSVKHKSAGSITAQQDTPKKHINIYTTGKYTYIAVDSLKNAGTLKKLHVKGLMAADSSGKHSNALTYTGTKKLKLNNNIYYSVTDSNRLLHVNTVNANNLLASVQLNGKKIVAIKTNLRNDSIVITPVDENGVAGKPIASRVEMAKVYINGSKADTTTRDKTLNQLLSKMDTNQLQKVTRIRLNGKTLGKGQTDSLLNNMRGWKVDKDGTITKEGRINTSNITVYGSTIDKNATRNFSFMNVLVEPINFNNKLIIIDGKEATPKELKKLSVDKIGTVENFDKTNPVLKTSNGFVSKYGDKAENGVVIITTKK